MTPARRRPSRRRRLLIAGSTAGILFGLTHFLGWTRPERSWAEASGWDRIPAEWRPASQDLWTGTSLAADPPRLDWLGHAGFRLRWKGVTLWIDPNLSRHCTIARRVLELPNQKALSAATTAELSSNSVDPKTVALISHAHFDHLDTSTLTRIGGLGRVVLPSGSEKYVASEELGGAQILGLNLWEPLAVGDLEITAVPVAHNGNRWHPLSSSNLAVGYVVRASEGSIYFAGDTGMGNDFAAIRERFRPDVAVLPIGAYSPSVPIGLYHLSPEQAVQVALGMGVTRVVPSHFGTFRLSLDGPAEALPRFARAASDARLEWVMPRLIGIEVSEVEEDHAVG